MFHLASKMFEPLLQPFNWFVLGGILAVWKSKGVARRWLLSGWIALIAFSNPWLADKVVKAWEPRQSLEAMKSDSYDAIVVLGGGIILCRDGAGNDIHAGKTFDRLFQAFRLWKANVAPRVILTGGTDPLFSVGPSEADLARKFLITLGMPDSAILTELASRSTWENATETKQLIRKQPELFPRNRLLLVTSALHIRRALWCFEHCSLSVSPFPCDFDFSPDLPLTPMSRVFQFLPSAEALNLWGRLFHEWVGLIAYRCQY